MMSSFNNFLVSLFLRYAPMSSNKMAILSSSSKLSLIYSKFSTVNGLIQRKKKTKKMSDEKFWFFKNAQV